MATLEQLQRFMNELALFKTTVKYGNPLSENQMQLVKYKMYELIFEMEAHARASTESDRSSKRMTG
jgi:hypothetical protein